ncbi:zinc protease PQQL-like [Magnolia sinica]|uniref:zinc protease PQQL-like n=1 Tax=Magnolia sinica TaxID=86752 RepID=UPI0026587FDC|nr:zinc protease PQQL-like [Magnolia sinica]
MAVVAVGDFTDTQSVVELIRTHFGGKVSISTPPLIPEFPVPSHGEPRFSSFVESEAAGVSTLKISVYLFTDRMLCVFQPFLNGGDSSAVDWPYMCIN